jgi:uncharacterized protein (DUF1697 family)
VQLESKQIALLRGINVGKAKRVAMADLRQLLESFGFSEVQTLLNSGNVVYRAPGVGPAAAGATIERGIAEQLGVKARVVVITAEELERAAEENPFRDEPALDPSRLLLGVLADPADKKKLDPLLAEDWSPDHFAVGTRVAYLWCQGGILESRLPEAFAKAMRDGVTSRNWATWQKLRVLAAET